MMTRRYGWALVAALQAGLAAQGCGSDTADVSDAVTGDGMAQGPSMSGSGSKPGMNGALQPGKPMQPAAGGAGASNPGKPGTGSTTPAVPEAQTSSKARVVAQVSDADRAALAKGNRALAFDLYGELAGGEDGNMFFSPYSISSALAMTYAGAKGATADQMRDTLHFDLDDQRLHAAFNAADLALTDSSADAADAAGKGSVDKDAPAPQKAFTLDVANALWAQQGKTFLPPFLDTLSTQYGAGIHLLNFADTTGSAAAINAWVEDKTHERIKNLLTPGDLEAAVFVLTNAIYFKGHWSHEFEVSATKDGPFHAPGGEQTAKVMHTVLNTSYARGEGYQAVALPYRASSTEMLLILPDAGKLADVEAKLDDKLISALDASTQGYEVTLSLPRFTFESRFAVAKTLQALGMVDAFQDGVADFSGMDGERDISIAAVIHKAFIAVDEKGAEAAAATGVIGVTTSAPLQMPKVELNFDRPFIAIIRDRVQGDILFMGRVQSVQP